MDQPTATERTPAPALPRRARPPGSGPGRFSPLTAPERETIDAFCDEHRAWALRQARRSYRHLPETLREQAVERALTEMRTRAPQSLERRALAADLSDHLTDALRHVHVGWCLNESSALLRREGTEPVQPEVRREDLAHFVDDGLGGLERAVLQLEIGAGRDTRAARAALRLGPRQYASHREAGLSKLRDAISAQVIGRACDQHVASIVAAATGDRSAMESLSGGPDRCRYCAREAQGLRSVLHERLAVAPWPIAIKPAGLLVAKLGAVGAIFSGGGGKAAGTGAGALGVTGGSGAGAAATVLAAAALATGTAAVVGDNGTRPARDGAAQSAERSGKAAEQARVRSGSAKASARGAKAKDRRSAKAVRVAQAGSGGASGGRGQTSAAAAPDASAATVATTGAGTPAAGAPGTSVSDVTKPITDTVDQATEQVTSGLPSAVSEPVGQAVDGVTDAVDDVGSTVDGLLPKP